MLLRLAFRSKKAHPFTPEDVPEHDIGQPTKDQKLLYAMCSDALGHLTDWLDRGKGICSQLGYETASGGVDGINFNELGGKLILAPLKKPERAESKVKSEYHGDWSKIQDIVRCTIAVDTAPEVDAVLTALKTHGLKLARKPKDRFLMPLPVGYRDFMVNVVFPNGVVGEIQIALKRMLSAKALGHIPYEVMQAVERRNHYKGSPLRTPLPSWPAEDQKAWTDAFHQSCKIYGQAWTEANGNVKARREGSNMNQTHGHYDYFDRDGALFRRPGGAGPVTEIFHQADKRWVPYQGSGSKVAMYGDPIEEKDLPQAARSRNHA